IIQRAVAGGQLPGPPHPVAAEATANLPGHAPSAVNAPTSTPIAHLTDREAEVLRLVALGMSNDEVAADLFIGRATVTTHVSNVLMKLHLRDRVQAVAYAYRHGIVSAD